MASNRINRINEEIMKELSSLLRTVKDPRVQDTMISITRVETTPDLRYTKVYVSFLQRENAKQALTGLKSADISAGNWAMLCSCAMPRKLSGRRTTASSTAQKC